MKREVRRRKNGGYGKKCRLVASHNSALMSLDTPSAFLSLPLYKPVTSQLCHFSSEVMAPTYQITRHQNP
jgi:hypothetical protein